MASFNKCIKPIIEQLDKFNPEADSPEHVLEEMSTILQTLNIKDESFILEVLSGCLEYKKLLEVVVTAFYAHAGKKCLWSDYNLFIVICYLSTFCLDKIGFRPFSKIIKSLDSVKMHKFLQFFFNIMNLTTWIKDEWSLIYDASYVKETWIEPLLKWEPEIQTLIKYLSNIIENRSVLHLENPKLTKPKEFNLTVPRPRSILIPDVLPVLKKPEPVPRSTYNRPRIQKELGVIKQKNRRRAEALLLKANMDAYSCAVTRPEKREETELNQLPDYKFKVSRKTKSKLPLVFYKPDNIPVKLNAAALYREEALYQHKAEKELRRIEDLLQGQKGFSEFIERQKKIQEKELEEKLAKAEHQILLGKLSREEAIMQHQNLIKENNKKANQKKEMIAKLKNEYMKQCLKEKKKRKKIIDQVTEGHKNVKTVQAKLRKTKQQLVQEVVQEIKQLHDQRLEIINEDNRRKCERVRELRSSESLPVIKDRFIDFTEDAGHGLFGEMSLVELQERLLLLKQQQKRDEEEKRDQIIREKQAKMNKLLEKAEQIAMCREACGRAAALKIEGKKRLEFHTPKAVSQDERNLELKKKIQEMMVQRQQQVDSLKAGPRKAKAGLEPWLRPKTPFEERHWKILEEGREKAYKKLQRNTATRAAEQREEYYVSALSGAQPCILSLNELMLPSHPIPFHHHHTAVVYWKEDWL
uniref:Cilia- and flagella-associated protein 99 isoform X1 n=1 Tax=Phascolarctos cinereus TaxID=38626 RepID=A0A6P5KSQ7_PHACI|nr:cilia- and flagella-associated protein 99 isoform X1 [Phascolarctos cinereus]XP_020847864.1 cilia- and flagella-associated protein 99 isoform X1 [Phascolarctos cinereus]